MKSLFEVPFFEDGLKFTYQIQILKRYAQIQNATIQLYLKTRHLASYGDNTQYPVLLMNLNKHAQILLYHFPQSDLESEFVFYKIFHSKNVFKRNSSSSSNISLAKKEMISHGWTYSLEGTVELIEKWIKLSYDIYDCKKRSVIDIQQSPRKRSNSAFDLSEHSRRVILGVKI